MCGGNNSHMASRIPPNLGDKLCNLLCLSVSTTGEDDGIVTPAITLHYIRLLVDTLISTC